MRVGLLSSHTPPEPLRLMQISEEGYVATKPSGASPWSPSLNR